MRKSWQDKVLYYKVIRHHRDQLCDAFDPINYTEVVAYVKNLKAAKKYLKLSNRDYSYSIEVEKCTATDLIQLLEVAYQQQAISSEEYMHILKINNIIN